MPPTGALLPHPFATWARADKAETHCFQRKYASGNPISRRLLAGFFAALARAVETAGDVQRVLEVGCGEGYSTQRLRRLLPASATLKAGDLDGRRLAAARMRNPGVEIV